jgi:ribosomal protein S15P/S13E
MATIAKFSIIEYGKNSELSQLTEGDCLRSDAKKLSPIKNLNCIMNEVNKLTTHFQNVDKDAFVNKYGHLMEIARVEVFKPSCASHSSFLGSRLPVFFWKHRPMSHYGGI